MNIHHLPDVALASVSARADRPATALLHDVPDARVVTFRIDAGMEVPVHTSTSTVLLVISSGSGVVAGREGDRQVRAGDLVTYEPGEPHGMRNDGQESLVIAAIIAPRPGDR
jgi:quercetin dioxygenase-like cupin family protein